MANGNAIHSTIKSLFLKESKEENIKETFLQFFKEEMSKISLKEKRKIHSDKDYQKLFLEMKKEGPRIIQETLSSFREEYPTYTFISSEEKLLEDISNGEYKFKFIIDIVFKDEKDGRYKIWDWKTTSWGWKPEKKSDKWTTYQLTYYKHFYSKSKNIPLENIDTSFVLLKRTAKKVFEEVPVKVGSKKITNALTILDNIVYNVKQDKFVKNKLSCTDCEFYKTIHCP